MGCGDVTLAMLWEIKHCYYARFYITIIDRVCFWDISVVQSATVSRYGRTRVIFHVYIAQFIPTTWRSQH